MTLILGIDSTTRKTSVALAEDGQLLAEARSEEEFAAEELTGLVRSVLSASDRSLAKLDLLAVGTGPGSFTGIRTGMAAAQGMAAALDLEVAGVSVLLARLIGSAGAEPDGLFVPSLRASPTERFYSLYALMPVKEIPLGSDYLYAGRIRIRSLSGTLAAPSETIESTAAELIETCLASGSLPSRFKDCGFVLFDADPLENSSPTPAGFVALSSALSCSITHNTPECTGLSRGSDGSGCLGRDFQRAKLGLGLEPLYVKKVAARTLAERGR